MLAITLPFAIRGGTSLPAPKLFFRMVCLLGIMATTVLLAPEPAGATPAVQYTNPLAAQRADPQIFKHTDGYYYLTATVPAYDRIVLRRATTLQGLATATETT